MTKINSTILTMEFQNFDIVLLKSKRKAIFFDGRFYFAADHWSYTTQDTLANTEIYLVEKIFRPNYYKGDAFRFLHNDHKDSHDLETIYEKKEICSCCGQTLPGGE